MPDRPQAPIPNEFRGLCSDGDPIPSVCEFLRARRPDTLRHVEAVADSACELLLAFEADPRQVELAAITHDLAAVVTAPRLIPIAEEIGLDLTPEDRLIPQILHGPIASIIVQRCLGVSNPDVINAVRYHTTLRRGASALEKIVFLADKLAYDPTTLNVGYLGAAQRALTVSLDEGVYAYLDFVVSNNAKLGWRLHGNLLGAWEELGGGRPRASGCGDATSL